AHGRSNRTSVPSEHYVGDSPDFKNYAPRGSLIVNADSNETINQPRNIVIFSDGTGQRGGLLFDERRSNIYKLFRATRCGPDSSVNPAEQLTFYDPGLGTIPVGHSFGIVGAVARWFYSLASQATALGFTRN